LAGQCASKIINTLECSGSSCWLNIVNYRCPRKCQQQQLQQQCQCCVAFIKCMCFVAHI
jgi:hypothetical protein